MPIRSVPLCSASAASATSLLVTALAGAATTVAAPLATFTAAISSSVWCTWAILLAAAAGGLAAESRTRWGAAVSAPLVSMFVTLAACNLGILPAVSPAYRLVHTLVVPLAVPLLLFSADLRRVASATGRLLPAFVLGTAATLVGTVAAWVAVPLPGTGAVASASAAAATATAASSAASHATGRAAAAAAATGSEAWKIAAALTARHIGGAVNFVAVCDATGATGSAVTAALAADNLVVAAFFLALFSLSRGHGPQESSPPPEGAAQSPPAAAAATRAAAVATLGGEEATAAFVPLCVRQMATCLALSATFFVAARGVLASGLLPAALGVVPTVTLLVVATATAVPAALAPYRATGGVLGSVLMQVFFAATGATGRVATVVATAPAWAAFSAVQLGVHLTVMLLLGERVLRMGRAELLLASNANVGGPTTAAGMAGSRGWTPLVVPCMLVGVLGYATGTFWALGIGHWLLRSGVLPAAAQLWGR